MALRVGETIELSIDDVAFGGDGVGRVGDCVVFVPFTITGERVRARVAAVKKQFATATLVEVLVASPHRVQPQCPHFGPSAKPLPCGGCQYQHIDYAQQLALKTAQIREGLRRIGGIDNPPLEPMIGSPRAYGCRNKITLRRRGHQAGYLATDNATLLNVRECPIADERINAALADLRKWLARQAGADGRAVEAEITLRHTNAGEVSWFVEPDEKAKGKSPPPTPMWVEEMVMDKRLKLPPASFFQVNSELLPEMVRLVEEGFLQSGCRTVVDAYCGVGLFALLLAKRAQCCHGIESDATAISAAKFNAERFGLANCHFARGKVEELLPQTLAQMEAGSCCVILDPPRAGCAPEVVETLLGARPKRIIYVSCNPPALARDLKRLVTAYELTRVVPLDMFPQTAHCEVVTKLGRSSV
jgi:23S rRNA (uracil1939-C5)-methyltransferase